MARDTARSLSDLSLSGTTQTKWSAPDLSEYVESMNLGDVSEVSDLSQEQKERIAATSAEGDASADTFEELVSFPLGITEFNEEAAESARSLRGRANDPEGLERLTRKILTQKFGQDVEKKQVDVDLEPPEAVKNAAQAALKAKEKYDDLSGCGTGVGEDRAQDIVNGDLTESDFTDGGDHETAIPDYLDSHSEDVAGITDPPTDWDKETWTDGCGPVQYALWGGTATGTGLEWAESTAQKIEDQMSDKDALEKRLDRLESLLDKEHMGFSEGDYVEWDSSGGTAYGQIQTIATGETVSGSLEPEGTEHQTSEDNPGAIVELVTRDDEGEVVGEGETVFHRLPELRKIQKDDVPMKEKSFRTKGNALGSMMESRIEEMDMPESDVEGMLASEASLDSSTIDEILNGGINCPPMGRLEAFADVLDVPVGDLVDAAMEDGCNYDMEKATKSAVGERRTMSFETKQFETKESGEDEFQFTAYGAVFGNKDRGGDILEPGAFKRTIDHNDGKFPLVADHKLGDLQNRLGVAYAKEDEHGVRVNGHINTDTQMGREAASHIRHAEKHGLSLGMSFGYEVVKDDFDPEKDARKLKEVKNHEFTVTQIPMNPESEVQGVKAFLNDEDALHQLADKIKSLLVEDSEFRSTLRQALDTGADDSQADLDSDASEIAEEIRDLAHTL